MVAREPSARLPVIVVGTSAWSSPWLTEQNLAFALAREHPVMYVEPPVLSLRRRGPDGRPRLRFEAVHGRRLVVFRPVVLPLRSRAASGRASAPFYRMQLRAVAHRLGLGRGLMISGDARPGIVNAAREQLSCYLVKDWIYDDTEILGRSSADLLGERDRMCAEVDIVIAISGRLKASLAEVGIDAVVVRHGFHSDLAPAYEAPEPAEFARLPAPRIVFAGRIDPRLDIAKLQAVARALPHGSVLLIGPLSPRIGRAEVAALSGVPNIHLLGARSRDELPAYLAHADCLLIPYRDNRWAHHGSPLKLWDYFYAGPPIVGSGYSTLSDFGSLLRFSNDDAEFAELVAAAAGDRNGRDSRRSFALENSWEARASELLGILSGRLAEDSVA